MRIQDLVEEALTLASLDGCVVIGAERSEANLRWANNSLTTNGQMTSRSITVISTIEVADGGTAAGIVTRAVTTSTELAELVAASEAAAQTATAADDAFPLVEKYETDDDWDAAPARTSIEVFGDFAPALGAAFAEAAAADRLLFGFAEHIMTSYFMASSTGLRRRFDQPTGRVEINGKSADLSRSAWVGVQTKNFADVDVQSLSAELAKRLDWAANRIDLPAGRYETLLPPGAVADLMIYAYWTSSARDAEEGRNVYSASDGATRIGEKLSPLPLSLRSDPSEPGLECAPFEIATSSSAALQSVFDNGAPIGPTSWISDGVLTNLVRTRNWAQRTGQAYVPLIDNLVLEVGAQADGSESSQIGSQIGTAMGTATLDDMIASTERGLLLTCLWYIREVDPQTLLLTGLTRDGVYLIENGQVVGAVNNFRFNESPVDLLGRITEVGQTVHTLPREWNDYFTRTAMPAVRVPDFNMSTVSQAS
ncbi:metallopeptidase TldD-related protein [Jatrophihabitans sp. DSM 45814]